MVLGFSVRGLTSESFPLLPARLFRAHFFFGFSDVCSWELVHLAWVTALLVAFVGSNFLSHF